jgi:hypothetical protein
MGVKRGSRVCCVESSIQKEEDFFHEEVGRKFKKETSKLFCTELKSGYFEKQITVQSSEVWCWRRMENIIWTDRMRNEETLRRVNEKKNILYTIIRRKTNWICHILRRN